MLDRHWTPPRPARWLFRLGLNHCHGSLFTLCSIFRALEVDFCCFKSPTKVELPCLRTLSGTQTLCLLIWFAWHWCVPGCLAKSTASEVPQKNSLVPTQTPSHRRSSNTLLAMEEEATQCTQDVVDPRRIGHNNSGLNDADIADVMCILHPCSPAAYSIVTDTARRAPQNVLQNGGFGEFQDGLTQSALEEQETFILNRGAPHQAMDLALRFSAKVKTPRIGFVFGRHVGSCDVVIDRCPSVSNTHFSIFINHSGVLMLQDMSKNGTVVDTMLLKGNSPKFPQTRMLNSGSIIQILSSNPDELVKFIVRIPSRENFTREYELWFQAYIQNVMRAEAAAKEEDRVMDQRPRAAQDQPCKSGALKARLVHNQHGMQWSGGDKYNVVGLIGKGAFATVYQLATKSEGQLFAAKELEKRRFMKNGVIDRKLDNEMQIMKSISHRNIVQYIDYVDHGSHMYIIMEFVPCGDLQDYLRLHGRLEEGLAKTMAAQVLDALAYLHQKKITHRDIKPDNILVASKDSSAFVVKLSDFGLSKVVKDNETFLKTFCGTLLYCAPEVFPHYDAHIAGKGRKRPRPTGAHIAQTPFHQYSQCVDIWSFGAVLWFSLCLEPPFEGVADNTGRGMFEKIMLTPLDDTDLISQGVSEDAISLLGEMLNTDPSARPSARDCLCHRWIGTTCPPVDSEGLRQRQLGPIAEEVERAADNGEFDVSGLSLNEGSSRDGSQRSEVSIHSQSSEFLGPRQSKRFKPDEAANREHDQQGIRSSSAVLGQSIPIFHQPATGHATGPDAQVQPPSRKLFGEISLSALCGANTPGQPDSQSVHSEGEGDFSESQQDTRSGSEQSLHREASLASPSLLGAEVMVRELNMDSPAHLDPQDTESNDLVQPKTPNLPGDSTGATNASDDLTPKQPPRPAFDRQIRIPIPASSYYDAKDSSTHNLEYATRVSGYNYIADPSYARSASATPENSAATDDNERDAAGKETPTVNPASDGFVKPAPRLGRLVSTADSFTPITITLNGRITTWGRAPTVTHSYPDKEDTRIPKRGIIIYFHSKDMHKLRDDDDQSWVHLPDLHCVISTQSRVPLHVNGVALPKGEGDMMHYGKIYSGDVVTVVSRGSDGQPGLKFVCEILHGEGKHARPKDGPRFTIESPTLGGTGRRFKEEKVASRLQDAMG